MTTRAPSPAESIFGRIDPKPKCYRDARGHFRKETPEEYRARYDDKAWDYKQATDAQWQAVANHIANSNPWEALVAK